MDYPVVAGESVKTRPNQSGASLIERTLAKVQWGAAPAVPSITSGFATINRMVAVSATGRKEPQVDNASYHPDHNSPNTTASFVNENTGGSYELSAGSADDPASSSPKSIRMPHSILKYNWPGAPQQEVLPKASTSRPPVLRLPPERSQSVLMPSPRHFLHNRSPALRFLEPEDCRCDSPTQEPYEHLPEIPQIRQGTLQDIVDGVFQFARSIHSLEEEPCDLAENLDTSPECIPIIETAMTRKILIIGSNYTRGARRTFTISSKITLESPSSDKECLRGAFQQRGYSVHSLFGDGFDQHQTLVRIAEFLATAECGDVRAIVFTGHATHVPGRVRPALVPPVCPARELAIPAEEWERTIRSSAKPGVIILSIFASCFSGHFMQQRINLNGLSAAPSAGSTSDSESGPILVTFASADRDQLSYESSIELHHPWRVADHLLHALNETARSTDVRDWQSFVTSMELHFGSARRIGASFADPAQDPELSPQTPLYTSSSYVPYSTLFPDIP